jgi:hypothetical protein
VLVSFSKSDGGLKPSSHQAKAGFDRDRTAAFWNANAMMPQDEGTVTVLISEGVREC